MKSLSSRLIGNSALTGVLLLGASLALPSAGHAADWLDSIQDQRCAPEDIQGVSGNARNAIEASVRRAEMSILPPTPVGDLGCLNDLMTAPLDLFSGIGGLLTNLQNGLQNFDASALGIDIDVSGMICAYAAEKFAFLTEPLSEMDKTISGYAALAANPEQRINGAASAAFEPVERGIWNDIYDSNTGGGSPSGTRISSSYTPVTGVIRTTDSSGYSGSVSDFVQADMTATESDVVEPIYVDDPIDEVFNDAAWAAYNQQLMRSFADYASCRFARSIDGTRVTGSYYGSGTWNTPGSSCNFGFIAYPSSASVMSVSPQSATVTPSSESVAPPPAAPVDRSSGQQRPAASEAAPAEKKSVSKSIWEQLAQ